MQACKYAGGEDGRKPASKTYVDLLRRRIEALEQVLRNHCIDVDASLAALSSSNKDLGGAGSLTMYEDPGHGETSPDVDALCDAFEGTLSIEEALNYEGDGEFRYFGPTSGRLQFMSDTVLDQGQGTSSARSQTKPVESTAANPRAEMNRRILAEDNSSHLVSENLRSELVNLYFKWQNPWLLVVDENLYRESLKTKGRYWSPLLENCILALGSRFTDSPEVRGDPADTNSAGQLFSKRAETYLAYDLKFPNITTIQSLYLLSTLSVSTGADATSWLRQGMAKQLALDLGINLDAQRVSGSNLIPKEEVELRRLLYWSMYCDDKLAAAYTGRVCTVLDAQGLVAWPSVPNVEATLFDQFGDVRNSRTLILQQHALMRLSQILENILVSL
ncbi:hypothetical protein N8I77_009570 [Diaporthe amygdali]|uniref:Xylanolytic transcriptional activator regulatory domain-containing protein n=1 Tax=Phomopsis amygdali TaxID=1214568 RepID=A0AAD9SBF4_PHOAM|nr:hypothetical protein N8I77_009570 [Diaporthe amygdali]